MAEITVTNEADAIADEIVVTLAAGTISAAKIFTNVEKASSVDRFIENRSSGARSGPIAGVVIGPTTEQDITDGRVGKVLSITVLIIAKGKNNETKTTIGTKLVNAVKNLINNDKPSTSTRFFGEAEGEMVDRVTFGDPEYDTETEKTAVYAELPVEIGYTTTTNTSN
jgi:hypothetical protein